MSFLPARALLTLVQVPADQDSKVPFHGTASQHLITQAVCISRVTHSQVKNLELFLVLFIWLVISRSSHFSRSLYRASLPSREPTALPNLVSSANLVY